MTIVIDGLIFCQRDTRGAEGTQGQKNVFLCEIFVFSCSAVNQKNQAIDVIWYDCLCLAVKNY
jgi:hypothetical protein